MYTSTKKNWKQKYSQVVRESKYFFAECLHVLEIQFSEE